jgi:hypothetical protein
VIGSSRIHLPTRELNQIEPDQSPEFTSRIRQSRPPPLVHHADQHRHVHAVTAHSRSISSRIFYFEFGFDGVEPDHEVAATGRRAPNLGVLQLITGIVPEMALDTLDNRPVVRPLGERDVAGLPDLPG